MGKLTAVQIAHKLRPFAHAIRPPDDRRRAKQLDKILTREGRVRADQLKGFVPYESVVLDLSPDDLPAMIPAELIADGSVTTAMFQYLAGLSSNVQAQLNALAAAGALASPGVQWFDFGPGTQVAGSPDASTASTSTYGVALSTTWTLPAGTWTITGLGGADFKHSASLDVDFYVEVGGTGALSRTGLLSSTVYTAWVDTTTVTGVTGGGAVTVKLLYRSHQAGTTTPQSAWVSLRAYRTA